MQQETIALLIPSLFLLVNILDLAPQHETLDGSLVQRPTREEYPHDEVGVGVAVEVLVEPEQDEGHQAVREPEEGEHRSDGLKEGFGLNLTYSGTITCYDVLTWRERMLL